MKTKLRCTWCGKGTTAKQLQKMQMCGPCTRMAERKTFAETVDSIPQEYEEILAQKISEQPTLALAASQMKKVYPLKHPYREWDMTIVILLDRRRRDRNGQYS